MKIVDWFKSLLSKSGKNKYMLNEKNMEVHIKQEKDDFIPRVDVDSIEHQKKSREDILRSLKDGIIVEDLSEQYNYTKFNNENIRKEYDRDSILSDEDLTALSCLYGAINEGNMQEDKTTNNKINIFLKKSSNNVVNLVNLMIGNAKSMYEGLDSEISQKTSIQGLIPGSYSDISEIIEEYNKEVVDMHMSEL